MLFMKTRMHKILQSHNNSWPKLKSTKQIYSALEASQHILNNNGLTKNKSPYIIYLNHLNQITYFKIK